MSNIPLSIAVTNNDRLLNFGKESAKLTDCLDKPISSTNFLLYSTSRVIKRNFSSSSAICLSVSVSETTHKLIHQSLRTRKSYRISVHYAFLFSHWELSGTTVRDIKSSAICPHGAFLRSLRLSGQSLKPIDSLTSVS